MYVGESVGRSLAFVLRPDGSGRDLSIPSSPLLGDRTYISESLQWILSSAATSRSHLRSLELSSERGLRVLSERVFRFASSKPARACVSLYEVARRPRATERNGIAGQITREVI